MKKHISAVYEVMDYKDCLFYQRLIERHYEEVRRKIGFYGRMKIAFNIAIGKWNHSMIYFPSGYSIARAIEDIAKEMDESQVEKDSADHCANRNKN